jgi:prepilin-type N-terminal cleavage/methylation domain-containing protein
MKMKAFLEKAKKGFTLVELITVMAIIAVLAGVSVGAYFGITENAKNSAVKQETDQMKTQLVAATTGDGYNSGTVTFKIDAITSFTAVMTDPTTITFTFAPSTITAAAGDVRYAIGYIVSENNATLTADSTNKIASSILVGTPDLSANTASITELDMMKDGKFAKTAFNGNAANYAGTAANFTSVTAA